MFAGTMVGNQLRNFPFLCVSRNAEHFKGALSENPPYIYMIDMMYSCTQLVQTAGRRFQSSVGGQKLSQPSVEYHHAVLRLPAVDPGLSKCGPDPKKQEAVNFNMVRQSYF